MKKYHLTEDDIPKKKNRASKEKSEGKKTKGKSKKEETDD